MVVDDEPVVLSTMKRLLRRRGYDDCVLCSSGREALEQLEVSSVNIVLLDLLMPEIDGLAVLKQAKPRHPRTEFIIISALEDVEQAVTALHLGAYDYLIKPVDQQRLLLTIERAYERLSMRAGLEGVAVSDVPEVFSGVLTVNSRMKEQLAYATALARGGRSVLISGESGTGKELVARGIHAAGRRPEGPFVAVNVAAVPENLFESQFFGHQKGSFTGAYVDHDGFFQQAHRGTLFLDEVGELPLHLQPKLLRVLEERTVPPIGGRKEIVVDVCVISATNCDLDKACAEGRFRLDLLYRLRGGHIILPPLRVRDGDIALLARHFLEKACQDMDRPSLELSTEALAWLEAYEFPGNIRELVNLMHNVTVRSLEARSNVVTVEALILGRSGVAVGASDNYAPSRLCSLRENEARHVAYILQAVHGDRHETARILGISLRQVQRKIVALQEDPRLRVFLGDI
ncbi:sigma-54 dependent transcriptional regulator [Desulfomicrobium sp. ZS1]|uniref:sigma-54-dependent transcriptional regulator n=1 Tax=Desulfomicrobium sp. ZS1 TaxID=2952228 RepID=UPI0020B2D936|nr:sigma-54 dependent transcriptional regulator [Desulfomicrobium sp. ZS1]UTF51186.1 sigma-54 dependent transcriptional regulator [Desulfomicrobium sp. ZS1]